MAEPLQNDPTFGIPPEIPTGTSTPVPDEVIVTSPAPSPVQTNIATPRQTLIDVLGPEAVSNPTPTAPRTETPLGMSMPRPAPAPSPALDQSLPIIEEPPFDRAVPLKEVSFGIPSEQQQPKPPTQETSTAPKPNVVSAPMTPMETLSAQQNVSAMDRVTDAARRASIRTLESDAAETINKKNLSVSSIALAQQQGAAKAVRDILPEEKSHTLPWVLGGVGLAVLGAIVVVIAYLMQTQAPTTPVVVTAPDSIIPGIEETTLDVTSMTRAKMIQTLSALPSAYAQKEGVSLVRLIAYAEQKDAEGNTVRSVENVLPVDFFNSLSARGTDRLERSLGKITYFGIVSRGGITTPFLAFEVISYESAFAGLLEWENSLPEDVPFITRTPVVLPPPPAPILPPTSTTTPTDTSTTTATTTPVAPAPTVVKVTTSAIPVFKDFSVKNKDTRAYFAEDGSVRILYSFLSQKLLIVAPDENTLTDVIDYISTARFSR